MEMHEDEAPPVIIDNGSFMCRAGFAGENSPRSIFDCIAGRPKIYSPYSLDMKDVYIGNEFWKRRSPLIPFKPIKNGLIDNFDIFEDYVNYILIYELRVFPEDHPVMITEPPNNPKLNREKMTEIVFENCNVPAFYTAIGQVLSLYSNGKTTGCVLDVGYTSTDAVPIYEGYAIQNSALRLNIGGENITENLQQLCEQRIKITHPELYNDVKAKLCYVALDANEEKEKFPAKFGELYELPDGEKITIFEERFICTECLFNGEALGVHQLLNNAIKRSNESLWSNMFENIVLAGSSTLFKGFPERLKKEIQRLNSKFGNNINIIAPPERQLSTWIGGSMLCSLSNFKRKWITKAEYEDVGSSMQNLKMVVVKRPVQHYELYGYRNNGGELIHSAHITGKTLQGAAMNAMNGLLHQLASLSLIATELFESILDMSKKTHARIEKISERVRNVHQKIPELEKYLYEQNERLLFATSSYQFPPEVLNTFYKKDQENIHKDNLPPALQHQYNENCIPNPSFGELDQYHEDGPCLKHYTNPNYFFEQWAKAELQKQEQKREEKKKRARQKKKLQQVEQVNLHRAQFTEHGERREIVQQQTTTEYAPPPPEDVSMDYVPPPPPIGDDIPPPPPPPGEVQSQYVPPPPPTEQYVPPPPGTNFIPPPPPPVMDAPPPPPPPGMNAPPPPPPAPGMNAPPPPPPPGNAPPPPPPPPAFESKPISIPQNTGGGSSIKVEQTQTKQLTGRGALLAQIQAGTKLRAVQRTERKPEPKKIDAPPTSVADILAKKFESAFGSDDEDDDEEEDDDWD